MLTLNPLKRIKIKDVLTHPFFSGIEKLLPSIVQQESEDFLKRTAILRKQTKII
jgi:hypothetical protein